ncbi:MAG: acyltransferase [Alphaproteobacteria bacterium]|nr:MAG: acyltransferase [Alphaproteobacteria bacterium]
MPAPLTLDAALTRGRHNNLDAIRLGAASAVVVSHAWPLALGRGATEPLEAALGLSLGGVAVLVFFFLSGLLITASAVRNAARPARFVAARVLRLFPGLAVALAVTVAMAKASGADAGLGEAAAYVLHGLSLVSLQHEISGAFAANPYPGAVNGPLWTLFYEVACYALIAGAVWLGLLRRAAGWAVAAALMAALLLLESGIGAALGGAMAHRLHVATPLMLAFFAGALFWRLRGRVVLNWAGGVAAVALAVATHGSALFLPAFIAALGYAACLLAFGLPVLKLKGDISYGVYVYGWPVAQLIVAFAGPMTPATLATLNLFAVLPFAAASWAFVEKPALGLLSRRRPAARAAALAN